MRIPLIRLAAIMATAASLLSPPMAAMAQDQPSNDPPARVGRLARQSGAVSFHGPGDTQWTRAPVNYPVVQGDAFWADSGAQAEVEVSASRIAMAPGTELDVATLTDTAFQATEPQGELYLGLRTANPQESYTVQTPRGLVTLNVPGRYGVVAGTTQDPTVVTAIEGSAHIEGPGLSLDVAPGQAATITGGDPFQAEVGPARQDAFLTAMLNSDRPRGAAPAAVVAMPGGEDLGQYGSWSEAPSYGQVWYPDVPPGWVPYREGSWAYVAPWGWTWVDSDPWGFAPFHYGRWAQIGGRWAWVPGERPAPAYAPALVTFFGAGAVAGAGIGAALAQGHVGWLPLGPREPFRPWYRASERYLERVNLGRPAPPPGGPMPPIGEFANRHAATVVPGGVFATSRPVGPSVQRVDPAQIAQAHPLVGQPPLRPTSATMGVTPAVARQLNLPPPSAATAAASGPAIHPPPGGSQAGPPSGPHFVPPLRPPAQPAAAGTGAPLVAAPALRPPPTPGHIGQPPVIAPHAPPTAGPVGPGQPPPAFYRAPGAVFQQPAPSAAFHPPEPSPPAMHAAPPAAFHPPAPTPPAPHAAPPAVFHPTPPAPAHPAPPPAAHAPPPTPVHAAPPPPVAHQPPPPQVHAAPPPPVAHQPPQEQNARHKRPGEP